jgi:hypothetical protein
MRILIRLVVIGFTISTLTLGVAVGVAAGSGTFGTTRVTTVSISNTHFDLGFLREAAGGNSNQGHGVKCDEDNDHHDHGTPGHKNHPCGDKGSDSD